MRDASAFVGQWPFALPGRATLTDLIASLRRAGFDAAAVSPLDAVLAPDPMPANTTLLSTSETPEFAIVPVPLIDPSLAGWTRHLAECRRLGRGRVTAVKVTPNYHSYRLDDPGVLALAAALTDAELRLCVQVRMADERSHHRLMRTPAVPADSVREFAGRFPTLPILVCGAYWSELSSYQDAPNVRVELSFVEHGDMPEALIGLIPPDRVLVGSHAPLHVPDAAVAKIRSDDLPAGAVEQLASINFDHFYGHVTDEERPRRAT